MKKIVTFLADNIGSSISVSSIGNTLVNEGLLEDGKRKGTPSAHTVQAYVNALLESYFYYDIKRFDIKGKEFLRTLGKYYIVDIGLRNYLIGFRNRDSGHALENVVYFELLRRGYDVAIGKVDNAEVDFVATKAEDKMYVQVHYMKRRYINTENYDLVNNLLSCKSLCKRSLFLSHSDQK